MGNLDGKLKLTESGFVRELAEGILEFLPACADGAAWTERNFSEGPINVCLDGNYDLSALSEKILAFIYQKAFNVWTLTPIDWSLFDAIEVNGVIDVDGLCEAVTDTEVVPHFWSVYGHTPEAGVVCIADRPTREDAVALATEWGGIHNLPVNAYSP